MFQGTLKKKKKILVSKLTNFRQKHGQKICLGGIGDANATISVKRFFLSDKNGSSVVAHSGSSA